MQSRRSSNADRTFWRVFDDSSVTQFDDYDGFRAPRQYKTPIRYPKTEREKELVRKELEKHLDWTNDVKTGFISVYCSEEAAIRSAEARVKQRKKNVCVACIIPNKATEKVIYRSVKSLARGIRYEIPPYVGDNADFEFVVWNRIPPEAVVDISCLN